VRKLFLDGLNQELNLRRQLIFSEPEWPTLDDIISSVIEEETRLSQPNEDGFNTADAHEALSMQDRYASKSFGKADKRMFFVITAKGMDTRKTHALSYMAIHLGGKKGDLAQGERRGQIGVMLITLQLQGRYHW
jgi:hypothetical protein